MAATNFVHCRACRSKLKRAAQMRMAAFCGPICWGKFYSAHCRVCDTDIAADRRRKARNGVNLCFGECRRAYNRNRAIYAGFERVAPAAEPAKPGDIAERANQGAQSTHFTGFSEAHFSEARFTVWNSAGKHSCSPVRHPRHPRMWIIGETVFTEAELKAYLRPKPKKKGNSIPRHLVGSSYRSPLCPECSSHMPLVDADLRKTIIDTEYGGWLREEDAAFTLPTPVPVEVHE